MYIYIYICRRGVSLFVLFCYFRDITAADKDTFAFLSTCFLRLLERIDELLNPPLSCPGFSNLPLLTRLRALKKSSVFFLGFGQYSGCLLISMHGAAELTYDQYLIYLQRPRWRLKIRCSAVWVETR